MSAGEGGDRIVAGITLRRQLFFAALLFTVALLLAEVVMRGVFHLRGDLPPTPDESAVYEWKWAQARLTGGSARVEGPNLLTFDPDLGWRPSPGYRRDGVRINAQGLRADRVFAEGPQPDRRRLALLGDSFTFGDHVANDETFAHFLESEELPGWEVLNFAANGYGTDQALLAYELHGGELAAEVVVMGFYVGDYERNVQRFKIYAKPVFVPGADGLRLANHPVPAPEQLFEEYRSGRRTVGDVDRPFLWLSLAKAWRRLEQRWPDRGDPEWQVLSGLMRRFRDHVRDQGATPVWMVIPYRDVVREPRSRYAPIAEMCEQEARELGMALLRLEPALRAEAAREPGAALYRPRAVGGHLSVRGHRVVARTLAEYLRGQGLVEAAGR